MNQTNILSHFTTLAPLMAAGGILAAVVAGWNHVKGWLTSIKRLLIVEAELSGPAQVAMSYYLISQWKRAPTGKLTIIAEMLPFRGKELQYAIPFSIEQSQSVAYKDGKFLWVQSAPNRNVTKISGVRFLVNLLDIVTESIRFYNEDFRPSNTNDRMKRVSRFCIIDIIGEEKTVSGRSRRVSKSEQTDESPISDSQSVQMSLEKSFMYSPEDYTPSGTKDPLEGLYYPDYIKDQFKRAHNWLNMGSWYAQRSLPWKLGFLYYGPAGTGKSSLACAKAKSLRIPIYRFFLNTLSDQEFIREYTNMNRPCVALLEDIDNTFKGREPITEHKSLSFDTVLNMISGVKDMDGTLLVVTTNRLDYIDDALGNLAANGESTRPGRVDKIVKIGLMEERERMEMTSHVLRDWPDLVAQVSSKKLDVDPTPAQWMETLLQIATKRMQEEDILDKLETKPPLKDYTRGKHNYNYGQLEPDSMDEGVESFYG